MVFSWIIPNLFTPGIVTSSHCVVGCSYRGQHSKSSLCPEWRSVMKPAHTTGFPSSFPTNFDSCFVITWSLIHNNHVITFLCSHNVTTNTHIMWPVPYFYSHSMMLSSMLYSNPYFYSPTPHHTLHFSTQTINLYSHSTTSLYDQLLLVTLYSHSKMFSLVPLYIPLSQCSHSMTQS